MDTRGEGDARLFDHSGLLGLELLHELSHLYLLCFIGLGRGEDGLYVLNQRRDGLPQLRLSHQRLLELLFRIICVT